MSYELLLGDAVQTMRGLPANSVQCCVTSPPYFGLRAYLDSEHPDKAMEIGTEQTPSDYVAKLVEVFREVRRVLRDDGTLFLNLGDSYASTGPKSNNNGLGASTLTTRTIMARRIEVEQAKGKNIPNALPPGLKPKDLIGIPWMVAFALRADGWWLRQEIIWAKTAPMPESVTDRCTKAHEQVFLLAKSATYYYDHIAIMEPNSNPDLTECAVNWRNRPNNGVWPSGTGGRMGSVRNGRNKRSVWTLGPESYSGAHYAVMPSKLVEPMILAGSSQRGACAECGSPYERVVERTAMEVRPGPSREARGENGRLRTQVNGTMTKPPTSTTLGWAATCLCGTTDVKPCVVLDPFMGSGTTLAVALKFGRNAIGIDIDERNLSLAHTRIERSQPMLLEATP